jgi:hypothetical protein
MVGNITLLTLQVLNHSRGVFEKKLTPVSPPYSFTLNENFTLSLSLAGPFTSAPKHHVVVLESGIYSVSVPFIFKSPALTASLPPVKLRKLYKHSGTYNLRIMVSDRSLQAPLLWHAGIVAYEANGEVVDNFTDVEWDFEPPPKTPGRFLTQVFSLLMFVPFGILLILLLINGVNCGYFPNSFFGAIVSLSFVAGLGAFFAFFVYFWKYVTFEDMFKYLLVILPGLGILLRGALGGRAKMVAKYARST